LDELKEKAGMGRRPNGQTAMTPTERQRKWRAKVRREKIWGTNADPNARRPTPHRCDLDFWPTPVCLRTALVQFVLQHLPTGPIWEPAAGDGALVDALLAAGREVIASDIAPQRPRIAALDFLTGKPPPETEGAILITTSPFGIIGDRFLHRALQLLDAGHLTAVVLLQRADHGGTDGRAEIFNQASHEFTCNWRPRWITGSQGNGRWFFSWLVWLAGSGPPTHQRIRRSDLKLTKAPAARA
jgi:hypothetical protein